MAAEAGFWRWVAVLPYEDSPRGDFIEDTRFLLGIGMDPTGRLAGASPEALREYHRLVDEYRRSRPSTVTP